MSAPDPTATAAAGADDTLAKYKKLLNTARQSLEANHKRLAEKDKSLELLGSQVEQLTRQKDQLLQALEAELSKNRGSAQNDEDVNSRPRRILRRVDVGEKLWFLFDYPDDTTSWLSFSGEQEALDFLSRLSGEPLRLPHRCFTPDESAALESECKRKIELLGEEFRRFKVQTSIAQKQRDAQVKSSPNLSFSTLTRQSSGSHLLAENVDGGPSHSLHRSGGGGVPLPAPGSDEVQRWKSAYEAAMAENERLRSRGEEAAQASQWRERFETCERERNEALDRLHSLLEPHSVSGGGRGAAETDYDSKRHDLLGPGAIYQRYLSLKEEFEIVRRKLAELEAGARSKNDQSVVIRKSHGTEDENKTEGYSASRVQHSRHLVLQYLSCKDRDVRVHMEDALIALFRANEAEKDAIMMRRRAEDGSSDSYVTSFTELLGLGEAFGGSQHGGLNGSSHGFGLNSSTHGRGR